MLDSTSQAWGEALRYFSTYLKTFQDVFYQIFLQEVLTRVKKFFKEKFLPAVFQDGSTYFKTFFLQGVFSILCNRGMSTHVKDNAITRNSLDLKDPWVNPVCN